jgi:hypothetical protein
MTPNLYLSVKADGTCPQLVIRWFRRAYRYNLYR